MTSTDFVQAQNLIRDLRAELYSTRTSLKEAQHQYELVRSQLSRAQQKAESDQSSLKALASTGQALKEKTMALAELQKETESLKAEERRLCKELELEKLHRQRAEQNHDRAEADRLRIQRLRDETARALLEAQARVRDLEEEQSRMEDAHHSEISSLQSRLDIDPASPQAHSRQVIDDPEIERQRADGLSIALDTLRQERDTAVLEAQSLKSRLASSLAKAVGDSPKSSPGMMTDVGRQKEDSATLVESPVKDNKAVALTDDVQELTSRIAQLNAVRDKLTVELDLQVEETERLAAENTTLTQAVLNARKISNAWEAQSNSCLVQIDNLKDMMEEAAMWQEPGAAEVPSHQSAQVALPSQQASSTSSPVPDSSHSAVALSEQGANVGESRLPEAKATVPELEKQVVVLQSRITTSDVYLQSLMAELTRQSDLIEDVQNWTLPALLSFKSNLESIMHLPAGDIFNRAALH